MTTKIINGDYESFVFPGGDLQVVYREGKLLKDYTLQEVRNNLQGSGISLSSPQQEAA